MLLEVLAHAEGLHPLIAEDGLHGGVGCEELLVVWIQEVVLLQVGPRLVRSSNEDIVSKSCRRTIGVNKWF